MNFKKITKTVEFIPLSLGVKNLATYFKNMDKESATTAMLEAFVEAEKYRYDNLNNYSSPKLVTSSGKLVFVVTRLESDLEFADRVRWEKSQEVKYKKQSNALKERKIKKLKKELELLEV